MRSGESASAQDKPSQQYRRRVEPVTAAARSGGYRVSEGQGPPAGVEERERHLDHVAVLGEN